MLIFTLTVRSECRRGASRGLACALGVLVGVLAVCCVCLSAAVVYLARPATSVSMTASSLESSTTNWTAANDALNLAGFPLQVRPTLYAVLSSGCTDGFACGNTISVAVTWNLLCRLT